MKVMSNKQEKIIPNHVFNQSPLRSSCLLLVVLALTACATDSAITDKTRNLQSPEQWQSQVTLSGSKLPTNQSSVKDSAQDYQALDGWLASLNDAKLTEMVRYALSNNYQLKAQQASVAIAKEKLNVAEATDFPELSLAMSSSRAKQVSAESESYNNNNEIGLQLAYELDLWGKLSDQQLQNKLTYAAEEAKYQGSRINTVAEIASAWFNLLEASQLLDLYQERAKNLKDNLTTIQAAYRLGLNEALDVYLTQNDVNREVARVAEQQQAVLKASRNLELLMGDYPNAAIKASKKLPVIKDDIPTGIPAELLTRRMDIKASWYELLALDAGLAVAHKEKFPRISLNATTGKSSDELNNLLDGNALAWSLVGNITMPIFNAGKLASLEEQARLAVVRKEQEYLQQVYQAFANVENHISNRNALKTQYNYYHLAKDNAIAAENLSFYQYLKGLVSYTTVLESQRRAFDAQTTLIQLTNQLLQNRIDVYIALGGNFNASENNTSENNTAEQQNAS